jgi:ABC-type Mn2+/Zn2+ transport system permease subunit
MSALAVSMIFFVKSTLVRMPGLDSCVWGLLLIVNESPLWFTVAVHVVFLFLTLHCHRVQPSLFCF